MHKAVPYIYIDTHGRPLALTLTRDAFTNALLHRTELHACQRVELHTCTIIVHLHIDRCTHQTNHRPKTLVFNFKTLTNKLRGWQDLFSQAVLRGNIHGRQANYRVSHHDEKVRIRLYALKVSLRTIIICIKIISD